MNFTMIIVNHICFGILFAFLSCFINATLFSLKLEFSEFLNMFCMCLTCLFNLLKLFSGSYNLQPKISVTYM